MKLEEQLYDVKRVAIAGHVKPDGDCVGSTLAVYNYIRKYHSEMEVELHLEPIPNIFKFLANADKIDSSYIEKEPYDLFIALDCGDEKRLGDAVKYFMQQNAPSVLTIISAIRTLQMQTTFSRRQVQPVSLYMNS